MSFEEIWQENKNFILLVFGGFIVFITAWFIVTGSIEDEINGNMNAANSHLRRAKSQALPSGLAREVEQELESLKTEVDRLEKRLAFRSEAGFTLLGATKSPDIHFNQTVQRLLTTVVEPAASLDIRIPPDLGLGTVTPRTDAEREWYLNGLDVVNRICLAAIAAQVESVEPLEIGKFPKKSGRDRDERPYLRELPVTFNARGRPDAIDYLLRELLAPNSRLVVETARTTSLEGKAKDRKKVSRFDEGVVTLEVKVKALIVDPAGVPANWPTARR
ncbi:MAG: hypothetical protein KDB18_12225 [Salinibacterium sp.]|nr:hypothetical protein [Planctomycetota bacterium]MCB1282277.1 hypothetical protein [Salinibacterium sp.]